MLRKFASVCRARLRRRRSCAALEALTDAQLYDIGLCRAEVLRLRALSRPPRA